MTGHQITDEELGAMTPDEIVTAHRGGQLAEQLDGRVPVRPHGPVTDDQLSEMTPEEIVAVHRGGQLDELLGHVELLDPGRKVRLWGSKNQIAALTCAVPEVRTGCCLKEADEHLADEPREQGGSRRAESQHLEAVYNRRDVSVLARPLGVVAHRVIVHGDRLEGCGMGVRQGAAGARKTPPAPVVAGALPRLSMSITCNVRLIGREHHSDPSNHVSGIRWSTWPRPDAE